MGDFVNYTRENMRREHIRITPTTLADGRDFFYLDDDRNTFPASRLAN